MEVFEELHEKGVGVYSWVRATVKAVEEFFYWADIDKHITQWRARCPICQSVKNDTVKNQDAYSRFQSQILLGERLIWTS